MGQSDALTKCHIQNNVIKSDYLNLDMIDIQRNLSGTFVYIDIKWKNPHKVLNILAYYANIQIM